MKASTGILYAVLALVAIVLAAGLGIVSRWINPSATNSWVMATGLALAAILMCTLVFRWVIKRWVSVREAIGEDASKQERESVFNSLADVPRSRFGILDDSWHALSQDPAQKKEYSDLEQIGDFLPRDRSCQKSR